MMQCKVVKSERKMCYIFSQVCFEKFEVMFRKFQLNRNKNWQGIIPNAQIIPSHVPTIICIQYMVKKTGTYV